MTHTSTARTRVLICASLAVLLAACKPSTDAQPIPPNSLDGWAMWQTDELVREVTAAYDAYAMHRAFRALHDFCAVQISAVYGNAMKDRLYCEAPNAPLRRRAQTVMHRMAIVLTKLLAPMLVFTADEAWQYIEHKPAGDRGRVSPAVNNVKNDGPDLLKPAG